MARHRNVIDVDDYEELIDEEPVRRERDSRSGGEESNNPNNFNNIDFSQFADLLQGVDMNQLNSMLGGFSFKRSNMLFTSSSFGESLNFTSGSQSREDSGWN